MIFFKYVVQIKSQNRFLNYTFGHWSLFPQRNGALLANRVLYINRNTNSNSSIVAPSGNHPALTPCEYFISESAFFIMTHFTRLQEISPWAYSSNFQLFLCSLHKRQNHCTSAMLLPSCVRYHWHCCWHNTSFFVAVKGSLLPLDPVVV